MHTVCVRFLTKCNNYVLIFLTAFSAASAVSTLELTVCEHVLDRRKSHPLLWRDKIAAGNAYCESPLQLYLSQQQSGITLFHYAKIARISPVSAILINFFARSLVVLKAHTYMLPNINHLRSGSTVTFLISEQLLVPAKV